MLVRARGTPIRENGSPVRKYFHSIVRIRTYVRFPTLRSSRCWRRRSLVVASWRARATFSRESRRPDESASRFSIFRTRGEGGIRDDDPRRSGSLHRSSFHLGTRIAVVDSKAAIHAVHAGKFVGRASSIGVGRRRRLFGVDHRCTRARHVTGRLAREEFFRIISPSCNFSNWTDTETRNH